MSARRWGLASRAALVLAVTALAGDAAIVRRALAPPPPVLPISAAPLGGSSADVPAPDAAAPDAVDAPSADPFDADRRAAPEDDSPAPASSSGASLAAPHLLGTVIVPGGLAVAVCEAPGVAPQSVHVGERFGDFTLVAVEQGYAVFRAVGGRRVTLAIPKPGS